MALKATVVKAELQISDLDRHHYATYHLTLAQHPSETEHRLMVRLIALALFANERLEFDKCLSAEDVPDLVATDSRKSLVPMDFVAVLTKVVQEHDNRVGDLENAVAAKDEAIQALAARLEALERGATVRGSMSEKQREARRDQVGSSPAVATAAPVPQQIETSEVLDNGR